MRDGATRVLPIFEQGDFYPLGMTTNDLAKVVDLSPSRIRDLVAQGVIPRRADGSFDAVEAVRNYVGHLRAALARAQTGARPREKFLAVKAELLELDLQERRGELIDAAVLGRELEKAILTFKQELLLLEQLAPELENQSAAAVLEKLRTRGTMILERISRAAHLDSGNGKGKGSGKTD